MIMSCLSSTPSAQNPLSPLPWDKASALQWGLMCTASVPSPPTTKNTPYPIPVYSSYIVTHSQYLKGSRALPSSCDFNSHHSLTVYMFSSSSLGELLHILQYPAQMLLRGRLLWPPPGRISYCVFCPLIPCQEILDLWGSFVPKKVK